MKSFRSWESPMLKNNLRIIPELRLDKDKAFSFTDKYTKEGQTLL